MVLRGVLALAAVARTARTLAQWRRVPDLSAAEATATVAAIVPARNEEATLPELLPALKRQVSRLIVVDDGSTDRTGEIAGEHAEVVHADGPPEGWAGKVHAMHLGVRATNDEEWLLFMDADCVPAPNLVPRLVATAEELGADLVSISARSETADPGWWFLLPAFNTLVFEGSPPDGRGVTALAVGHCILVRRKAFELAGGWEALAASHADDVGIATAIRDSGGVPRFVDGGAALTTSGLAGVGQTWRSLRKSIVGGSHEILGDRAKLLLGIAGVLHILYGLAPVFAARRSKLALIAWAAQSAAHLEFVRRVGQPKASAVLAPFSWAAIGVFLLDCALHRDTTWKGRRVG
ncbi:glycosyl transferase family 2 [Lentzea sp. NBRC 105346]|uniref:glycosyltransferase n=1 Tax=Lentzea sp. NBRC 105346 TaxID=3032205 RepID=UPI0024A51EC0|nr:glycosyltransferase family 2 protein [Lentzea sp. NBRC 105346]GLZ30817.1 glycosyl transferase family 2 [Lentzea sp. NBRC 105346]